MNNIYNVFSSAEPKAPQAGLIYDLSCCIGGKYF